MISVTWRLEPYIIYEKNFFTKTNGGTVPFRFWSIVRNFAFSKLFFSMMTECGPLILWVISYIESLYQMDIVFFYFQDVMNVLFPFPLANILKTQVQLLFCFNLQPKFDCHL